MKRKNKDMGIREVFVLGMESDQSKRGSSETASELSLFLQEAKGL